MSPRPPSTQIEFLLSTRGGFRIVKMGRCENDAQFSQQFVEDIVSIRETGKLDAVAIDVAHDCFFHGNDKFSKVAQGGGMTAKELNQRMRVFQGT